METAAMRGSYNTTGPDPVPVKELVQAIVKAKKAHAILVPVPYFALRAAMGEMAEMLFCSQNCSDKKVRDTGYRFAYPDLEAALSAIYPPG
jgi:NAD dependent epimerase/dehydratase family enzyme